MQEGCSTVEKIVIEIVIEIGRRCSIMQKIVLTILILISQGHFPEKIGLGSADFLHSATGYIEIAVCIARRFQSRFQPRFSAQWTTPLTE